MIRQTGDIIERSGIFTPYQFPPHVRQVDFGAPDLPASEDDPDVSEEGCVRERKRRDSPAFLIGNNLRRSKCPCLEEAKCRSSVFRNRAISNPEYASFSSEATCQDLEAETDANQSDPRVFVLRVDTSR